MVLRAMLHFGTSKAPIDPNRKNQTVHPFTDPLFGSFFPFWICWQPFFVSFFSFFPPQNATQSWTNWSFSFFSVILPWFFSSIESEHEHKYLTAHTFFNTAPGPEPRECWLLIDPQLRFLVEVNPLAKAQHVACAKAQNGVTMSHARPCLIFRGPTGSGLAKSGNSSGFWLFGYPPSADHKWGFGVVRFHLLGGMPPSMHTSNLVHTGFRAVAATPWIVLATKKKKKNVGLIGSILSQR